MAYNNNYKGKNGNYKGKSSGYKSQKTQQGTDKHKEPARAPYNFVSFPNQVVARYKNESDIPKFDKFRSDLNSGYIDFEFTNETDLFVGGRKDRDNSNEVEFFTNSNGNICIPGSTIRGVIRKNCEILSFSYPEFIDDRTYLYRNFAGKKGKLKDEYKEIINVKRGENDISDVVKVGYIYKEGYDYKLIPIQEINGKCFRQINEKRLRDDFKVSEREIRYMYTDALSEFKSTKKKSKNEVAKMNRKEKELYENEVKKELTDYLKNCTNRYYKPYKINVTFDIDEEKDDIKDIKIEKSKKRYEKKGILFNSNRLLPKLSHYLIYDIDESKTEYIIEDNIVLDYKKDIEMFKSQRNSLIKKQGMKEDYYDLPKKEGKDHKKIFFYKLEDDKVKYLGKTPYLRVSYNNSQKNLLKINKLSKGLDYVQSIFGYITDDEEKNNFKSRVSFMDTLCESNDIDSREHNLVLSSPKPTSQQLYLKQSSHNLSELNTYNQENSELRGYKFYWNKSINKKDSNVENLSVKTNMKNVLKPDNRFKSRVYFENLSNDELGLLLLSIKFNDNSRDNIGMGKPYGYGRINIKKIELYLEDIDMKFTSFDNNYKKVDNKDIYISEFKSYISNKIGSDYMDETCIREYIKSKTSIKEKDEVSYMEISKKTGSLDRNGKQTSINEYTTLGMLPNTLDV